MRLFVSKCKRCDGTFRHQDIEKDFCDKCAESMLNSIEGNENWNYKQTEKLLLKN